MRLADSFPQNANAKLHIIFQISITFTAKIDDIINFFDYLSIHYIIYRQLSASFLQLFEQLPELNLLFSIINANFVCHK